MQVSHTVSPVSSFAREAIEIKSTATLIDELFTARMKLAAFIEAGASYTEIKQRVDQLEAVVSRRVNAVPLTINGQKQFNGLTTKLKCVLQECWDAQEKVYAGSTVYSAEDLARAGADAQRTNRQRNNLMRDIDELLGEVEVRALEKTYA